MRRSLVLVLAIAALAATGVAAAVGAVGRAGDPPPRIAFVAKGVNPADALAAGAIAGQLGAPLFTTDPLSLSPAAGAGLAAYEPVLVLVLGGPAAIEETVVMEISRVTGLAVTAVEKPTDGVARVAGPDRFATAAAVADLLNAYDTACLKVDATSLAAIDSDTLDGLDSSAFALADVACPDGDVVTGTGADGRPRCTTVAGEAGPQGEPGPPGIADVEVVENSVTRTLGPIGRA